ncbi:MAG: hypothetical protein ACK4G3_03455 [bacterium]
MKRIRVVEGNFEWIIAARKDWWRKPAIRSWEDTRNMVLVGLGVMRIF